MDYDPPVSWEEQQYLTVKRENDALREQNRVLASLLAKAQPHVCSALCPSVKRDGDLWTHKDLCAHMEAALTATSQPEPCTNHFSDGSKIFPSRDCCKPATSQPVRQKRSYSHHPAFDEYGEHR